MDPARPTSRRGVLTGGLFVAMWAALLASYGTFAGFAARFLFPSRRQGGNWTYVADVASLPPGSARSYVSPEGATITVARPGTGTATEDFIALSSVCPHLGCQVHWEAQNDRFFCPCHNGVFSPEGQGVSGPPGDAGQDLPRYPVKVEAGLVYLDVPMADGLAGAGLQPLEPETSGPGHDPCLMASARRGKERLA